MTGRALEPAPPARGAPGTPQTVALAHLLHPGPADAAPLVLVQGLGMQSIDWPPALLATLARRHPLILVDNRDGGLSPLCGPAVEPAAALHAENLFGPHPAPAPYSLFDMADDVVALLERLGVGRFHLLGFSMGGMIAQIIAARQAGRVLSLVSLMSSGGEPWIRCTLPVRAALIESMVGHASPAAAVRFAVASARLYGVKARDADDTALAADASSAIARSYRPGGILRQALAMRGSGDRRDLLGAIAAPALVVHGRVDDCIHPDQARNAAALIPTSRLILLDRVGHDPADLNSEDLAAWMSENLRCA